MTDTAQRRPAAPRLLLACAVLAAATLTGFLVRHLQPAPDAAATAPWTTVCNGHAHGGEDLHRLLGGGPTVAAVWSAYHFPPGSLDGNAHQLCTLSVGNAFLSIDADRLTAAWARHVEGTYTSAPPGERFPAGDAGVVLPTSARALVTCRAPGSPSFRAQITMDLRGPAAHRPDRRHLMENVVRDWANDLGHTKNCGWPADPAPALHARKDTK